MTTEYLYQQEIDRVLSALMPQNQLIVRVMLHTGMRLSDVLELRSEGLSTSGWYTEGKTGKKRRYGLPRPLYEAIMEQAGPEWAFPGRYRGRHKTRQGVWKDIKRAATAFRLPQNVGAHSFRKVYAVKLMRKYGKIERVQKNLNHASGSVTAIYAMADVLLDRRLAARDRRRKRQPTTGGRGRRGGPKGSSEAKEEQDAARPPGGAGARRKGAAATGDGAQGEARAGTRRAAPTAPARTEQQHPFCADHCIAQNGCFVTSGRRAGRSQRAAPSEAGRGTGAGTERRAQARAGPEPPRPGGRPAAHGSAPSSLGIVLIL